MNGNSSLRAMYGPVFGDSVGGLVSWRMAAFGAALAAVMSLIVVVRHTREEEETGRQEMLSSAMVGRRAPLTAALLAAVIANAALALVIAAGLAGSGASGAGAVALALAVAGTGVLFACTAAIAAQFTESARLAKGLTAAVIGAAFVLKAAGDSASDDGSSVLTWLSPSAGPRTSGRTRTSAGGCCSSSRRPSLSRPSSRTPWPGGAMSG